MGELAAHHPEPKDQRSTGQQQRKGGELAAHHPQPETQKSTEVHSSATATNSPQSTEVHSSATATDSAKARGAEIHG